MQVVDRILGYFLVLLGCIHNFVAAPMTYDRLSPQALWFVSAGLALWYAGFINLLRSKSNEPNKLLLVFCILTNASLLAFVVTYALLRGNWTASEAVALIAAVATLTAMSIVSAFRARRSA